MQTLPVELLPLIVEFQPFFSKSVWGNAQTLLVGAVPKDGLLLVAFAGHGIERDKQAYLLPSNARIYGDMELLQETSISVTRMKDAIRAVASARWFYSSTPVATIRLRAVRIRSTR